MDVLSEEPQDKTPYVKVLGNPVDQISRDDTAQIPDPSTHFSEELIENRCYLKQQLLQLDKWGQLANEEHSDSLNTPPNFLQIIEKVRKRSKTYINICVLPVYTH